MSGDRAEEFRGFLSMSVLHTHYITHIYVFVTIDKHDLCANWDQGLKTHFGS